MYGHTESLGVSIFHGGADRIRNGNVLWRGPCRRHRARLNVLDFNNGLPLISLIRISGAEVNEVSGVNSAATLAVKTPKYDGFHWVERHMTAQCRCNYRQQSLASLRRVCGVRA